MNRKRSREDEDEDHGYEEFDGHTDSAAAYAPPTKKPRLGGHADAEPPRSGHNARMHENNKYLNKRPDFRALAAKYDYFKKFVRGAKIDFTNPDALRALTTALLEDDFNLKVVIPRDRLCPTVTLRLNYLLWINDLLEFSPKPAGRAIRGLDIGTGSVAIYPLLGVRMFSWSFLATDINGESLQSSEENVARNGMSASVELRQAEEGRILDGVAAPEDKFDFCMCNPPFFSDRSEAEKNPRTANTGGLHEMVTPGGEEAFVSQIVRESLQSPTMCRWFTTMMGKKSTLKLIKRQLKEAGVVNMRQTSLLQGRTIRWALAWSFTEDGLEQLKVDRKAYFAELEANRVKKPPTAKAIAEMKARAPVDGVQIAVSCQSVEDAYAGAADILKELGCNAQRTATGFEAEAFSPDRSAALRFVVQVMQKDDSMCLVNLQKFDEGTGNGVGKVWRRIRKRFQKCGTLVE